MKKIKLSYFTPTYNREKLLPNLYNSLLRQTNKNFIWLIIDDGSTDNTESLVNSWIKENKIKIQYHKKPNGGKHTAIDFSNQVCETEFICCIDSDDYLTDDATEILYSKFNLCNDKDCCGLLGPKKILNSPKNDQWIIDNQKIYFYDLKNLLGFIPETTIILKTEIAKKYHFPVFEDEKFVTESVYYQQFFYDYQFVTFNELIYIAEYQDDGYTQMGMRLFIKNPKGYACALKQNVFFAIKNKNHFKLKIKKVLLYYAWKSNFKLKNDFMPEYKIPLFYKTIGIITLPLSKILLQKRLKNEK